MFRTRFTGVLVFLACVFLADVGLSQAIPQEGEELGEIWTADSKVPANGKTNRKLQPLDDLLSTYIKENQLPGVTVAVTYKKRLIYQRGFGYAELNPKVPMEADALMRIASVTKPITGVAIMRLVDQGELTLDDKVFDILEQVPMDKGTVDSRTANITVRHLLNHTGGYDRDKSFDPMFRSLTIGKALGKPNTQINTDDVIAYMLSQKLDFTPGEKNAYSNYGYCLLGRIIEKKTGQTYEAYVREEILKPVGINRMKIGAALLADRDEDEPRYYMRKQEYGDAVVGDDIRSRVPLQYGGSNLGNMDSHGAWLSSAADLVKFASQLDRPNRCKWMKADSVLALFAMPDYLGHKKESGKSLRYYAAGWQVVQSSRGTNAYHSGALAGSSSMLVKRYDEVNWAILFNCRKTPDGKEAAGNIDSQMHNAVNAVKKNFGLK